jgi:hypothetical protein
MGDEGEQFTVGDGAWSCVLHVRLGVDVPLVRCFARTHTSICLGGVCACLDPKAPERHLLIDKVMNQFVCSAFDTGVQPDVPPSSMEI